VDDVAGDAEPVENQLGFPPLTQLYGPATRTGFGQLGELPRPPRSDDASGLARDCTQEPFRQCFIIRPQRGASNVGTGISDAQIEPWKHAQQLRPGLAVAGRV
jgi:hypothetical protein